MGWIGIASLTGSAALTALALFLSYTQVMGLSAIDLMSSTGGYKIVAVFGPMILAIHTWLRSLF